MDNASTARARRAYYASERLGAVAGWSARLQGLCDFSGIEPNPIPVKALLEHQGIGHGLRLPLQPLSEAHRATASRIAQDVDALERSCREDIAA